MAFSLFFVVDIVCITKLVGFIMDLHTGYA